MASEKKPPTIEQLLAENYALKQSKLAQAVEIRKLVKAKAKADAQVVTALASVRAYKRLKQPPPLKSMDVYEIIRRIAFVQEQRRRGINH